MFNEIWGQALYAVSSSKICIDIHTFVVLAVLFGGIYYLNLFLPRLDEATAAMRNQVAGVMCNKWLTWKFTFFVTA